MDEAAIRSLRQRCQTARLIATASEAAAKGVSTWAAAALLCLVTGAASVWLGGADFGDPRGFLVAFLISSAAMAGPLYFLRRDLLGEPVAYYCVVSLAVLTGTAILWIGDPDTSVGIQRRDVSLALLLTAAGFAALACGYIAGRPRQHRASVRLRPFVPSFGAIVTLAAVGFACKVALIVTGGSGLAATVDVAHSPFVQVIQSISFALEAAAMLLVVRLPFERRGVSRSVAIAGLVILLCLAVSLNLMSGFLKAGAVALVVPLAIGYYQHSRRVPVGPALVAIILAFLALPVILSLRDLGRASSTPASLATRLPEAVAQTFSAPSAAVPQVNQKLRGRLRQIDNLALVIRDTPSMQPYRGLEGLLVDAPAVALVPRALWPGKPVLNPGLEFARDYYGQPTSIRSTIGVTQIGDMYRHDGIVVVLVGMFVIGLALAVARRGIRCRRPEVYVAGAFATVALVDVEDDIASVLSNTIRWAVATGIITLLAARAFPFSEPR